MPYSPSQKVPIKVELRINGVWVDVTQRGRSAGDVRIKHALSDGARQPETSEMDIRLGNDDGWLTEDNPVSPWWPHIGRGTAIRLSLTGILPGDAGQFAGTIDRMEAVYPGGDSSAMDIEAIGTWGGIAQDDEELRSALHRSIVGTAPGDFIPHDYWSGEDGRDSGQFANAIAGHTAAIPVGPVSWSVDGPAGSAPLPHLAEGAQVSFPIAPYADAGQWAIGIALKIPEVPASSTTILEVPHVGGPIAVRRLEIKPPGGFGVPEIHWSAYDSAGTLLDAEFELIGFDPAGPSEDEFFGHWIFFTLASEQDGGNVRTWFGFSDGRPNYNNIGFGVAAGTHQALAGKMNISVPAALDGLGVGHTVVFVDPAFNPFTDGLAHFSAFAGWSNERVTDRLARLYAEEQRTITIHGVSNTRMGPQPIGTFAQIVTQCVEADGGLLFDDPTDPGSVYRALVDLFNQDPKVQVLRGSLTPDTRPVWDHQHTRNQWTVSRINGSSATVTDEEHAARVGRVLKDSASLSLASDSVLPNQAGWRTAVSTTPGPRYPALGINLRDADGALLAEQIVGLVPGDRMTIAAAAFPSQHPPGGADLMVIGWETTLDADEWVVRPVCVPYGRFGEIGAYGSAATVARRDSAHSMLAAAVDADDTALLVVTELDHALWRTGSTAPTFPFDAKCSGIRLPVSAIASSVRDTFTRSVGAGSWGTSDSGHTYQLSGTAADFSANGSQGVIAPGAVNSERHATVNAGMSGVQDARIWCTVPVVPTGAPINWGLLLRYTDANNYYWIDAQVAPDSSITLRLIKRVSSVITQFPNTVVAPIAHSTTVPRVLRAQYSPATGVLRARFWSSDAAEPTHVWHIDTVDTAVPAGTRVGAIGRLMVGNTNVSPQLRFDNFALLNPQAFTVTRSADGVDKALPTGEKVSLWRPARYGL